MPWTLMSKTPPEHHKNTKQQVSDFKQNQINLNDQHNKVQNIKTKLKQYTVQVKTIINN